MPRLLLGLIGSSKSSLLARSGLVNHVVANPSGKFQSSLFIKKALSKQQPTDYVVLILNFVDGGDTYFGSVLPLYH